MATLAPKLAPVGRPESISIPRAQGALNGRPYLMNVQARRVTGSTTCKFIALPHENEDAQITGGTRSLMRRLLGLNLPGSLKRGPGRVGLPQVSDAKLA